MKTKKELRNIAKDSLVNALAKAYYAVVDNADYLDLTEEETEQVITLMDNYGQTMCKAIRKEYHTV